MSNHCYVVQRCVNIPLDHECYYAWGSEPEDKSRSALEEYFTTYQSRLLFSEMKISPHIYLPDGSKKAHQLEQCWEQTTVGFSPVRTAQAQEAMTLTMTNGKTRLPQTNRQIVSPPRLKDIDPKVTKTYCCIYERRRNFERRKSMNSFSESIMKLTVAPSIWRYSLSIGSQFEPCTYSKCHLPRQKLQPVQTIRQYISLFWRKCAPYQEWPITFWFELCLTVVLLSNAHLYPTSNALRSPKHVTV